MRKTIAGLLTAATSLAVAPVAHAVTIAQPNVETTLRVESYADLLKPVPNAVAVLRASDEENARAELLAPATDGDATLVEAQFRHHHHRFYRHHHHHHRFFPRFYRHHHHHHHSYRY